MSKSSSRRLVAALLILDSVGVTLALLAGYWLRIASGLLPERAFEEFAVYLRVSALIVPIFLVIFAFNNLYDVRLVRGGMEEYVQIAKSFIYGIVALVRRVLAWLHRRGRLRTRMLIVGANEQGQAIARQFRAAAGAGVDVIGFIDDFLPVGAPVPLADDPELTLRVLGGPDRLHDVAQGQQRRGLGDLSGDHAAPERQPRAGALRDQAVPRILRDSDHRRAGDAAGLRAPVAGQP